MSYRCGFPYLSFEFMRHQFSFTIQLGKPTVQSAWHRNENPFYFSCWRSLALTANFIFNFITVFSYMMIFIFNWHCRHNLPSLPFYCSTSFYRLSWAPHCICTCGSRFIFYNVWFDHSFRVQFASSKTIHTCVHCFHFHFQHDVVQWIQSLWDTIWYDRWWRFSTAVCWA